MAFLSRKQNLTFSEIAWNKHVETILRVFKCMALMKVALIQKEIANATRVKITKKSISFQNKFFIRAILAKTDQILISSSMQTIQPLISAVGNWKTRAVGRKACACKTHAFGVVFKFEK